MRKTRAGQDMVDPVGSIDQTGPFGTRETHGARDLLDPVVPGADDGVQRILMAIKSARICPQAGAGRSPSIHLRDLRIPLHQFGRNPGDGVGGVTSDGSLRKFHEDVAVVRRHLGKSRMIDLLPAGNGDDSCDEFPDASFWWRPSDDRMPSAFFQRVRVNADPLFFRHIQHVDGHDHRRSQEQEYREKIKASLQGRSVRQKTMTSGPRDDEIPG